MNEKSETGENRENGERERTGRTQKGRTQALFSVSSWSDIRKGPVKPSQTQSTALHFQRHSPHRRSNPVKPSQTGSNQFFNLDDPRRSIAGAGQESWSAGLQPAYSGIFSGKPGATWCSEASNRVKPSQTSVSTWTIPSTPLRVQDKEVGAPACSRLSAGFFGESRVQLGAPRHQTGSNRVTH
jgi:hypothetical protein